MAADGRIIIDTLVHTDKAERSLTALRSKAKSTAQEIAATGKKLDALKGNTKLKEELDAARDALQNLQAEAQGLHDLLPRTRGTEMEETAARWAAEAEDRAVKQALAVEKASAAYEQQQAQIQKLTQQHEELTARLQQEQAAADKAGARFRLGMGLKTFGGTLTGAAKQGAAGFGKLAASSLSFSRGMQSCEKSARRFNSRLRGIVSSALIFNGLSKALRSLTGTFGAALTKSAAFNQSLANLKGASATAAAPLMQALTPALTALANAAATAMGYVAQMISFFTGKSIANMQATAKALTGVAGAGSEAASSLAGFDELNVLNKDAGGAGSAGTAPNFGFTPGESPFWQSVTQAIKGGDWAGAGQLFADKMNALVDGWDGAAFGAKLGRTLQNGVDFAFALVTGTDWSAAGAKLGQALSSFMPQLDGKKIGALLVSAITIGLSVLYGFLTNTDPTELAKLLSDIAIGALDAMAQALGQYDWGELAGRVLEFLINLDWEGILKSLGDVIAAAWPVILAMIVGSAFAALNPLALAGLAALAVLILKFLSGMSSDVKEGLVQGFKNGINAVIDLVNKFVGWLNRTLRFTWEPFKLGRTEVFPGGSMQLANLPTVPYLAQGAVIPPNREFLAVLGDQRSGTNIEAPEATLRKIMAEVLAEYGRSAPEQRDITVNLTAALDGEVIYRNQQKIKAGKGYPAGLNPAFG